MQRSTRPMLALPFGEGDWSGGNGARWQFLKSCVPILDRLGWCIGIEVKGATLGEWAKDCFAAVKELNGRIVAHPPAGIARGMGDPENPIQEKLLVLAKQVPEYIELGLEAVTIHCAPAVSTDPPEDMGPERYNSPISAEEMLTHIKAQVEPLRQLNELMGGILYIENVDITNFRDGGYRVPTYLQLQTGCWLDLGWLKKQTGVRTTFDSEHHLCAGNLLRRRRQNDLVNLPTCWTNHGMDTVNPRTPIEELAAITGYALEKGKAPVVARNTEWRDFITYIEPSLFHLGGATRAVDEKGRIDTHLPSFDHPLTKEMLKYELTWTMEHPEVIGCVVEVTGQLQPEKYSEWSPRPHDDDVAKMRTYLDIIDRIEDLQKSK